MELRARGRGRPDLARPVIAVLPCSTVAHPQGSGLAGRLLLPEVAFPGSSVDHPMDVLSLSAESLTSVMFSWYLS